MEEIDIEKRQLWLLLLALRDGRTLSGPLLSFNMYTQARIVFNDRLLALEPQTFLSLVCGVLEGDLIKTVGRQGYKLTKAGMDVCDEISRDFDLISKEQPTHLGKPKPTA